MTEIITSLIGGACGLSTVIVSALYYRENHNRKVAEINAIEIKTKSIEADSLTNVIHQLQKDRDSMRIEINDLNVQIVGLKKAMGVSETEKITIERDLNIHKRALGCRVNCPIEVCPIENKINELIK